MRNVLHAWPKNVLKSVRNVVEHCGPDSASFLVNCLHYVVQLARRELMLGRKTKKCEAKNVLFSTDKVPLIANMLCDLPSKCIKYSCLAHYF